MTEGENSTRNKKTWQYAFLTGIAACIVSTVLVFGASLLTTVLTVSTLIVGILNSLLGSGSQGSGQNWFLAGLKRAFDVGRFLKVATVAVWLATMSLTSYGIWHSYHESQKITLEGHVLTAGGEPAGNAIVTLFLGKKKETMTTADGKFTFTEVDVSNEPSRKLHIEAAWKNKTGEETVDLSTGSLKSLVIRLPPGDPPFRVSYILLEGVGIDFLVRGEIDKRWEERLGGQPFIIPNSVFNSLKDMIKNYSTKFEGGDGVEFEIETKSGSKVDEKLVAKNIGKQFFKGSQARSLSRDPSKEDLLSLLDSKQQWSIEVNSVPREQSVGPRSITLWKFADRDDLKSFNDKFLSYLTRDDMPPEFCLLTINTGLPCGEDTREATAVNLVSRVLQLRVAVVENITSQAIRIGKFSVKENGSEKLRSSEEDESTLNTRGSEKRDLFPLVTLGPHEKLLIPMEMPLAYDKDNDPELYVFNDPASSNERNRIARELTKLGGFNFNREVGDLAFEVQSAELLNILNRPKRSPLLERSYIFGPSISIESVEVDNVEYPFRQYDVGKLVVRIGGGIGSCPSIYTYSSASSAWLYEGHILYGINGKRKESVDEKQLNNFDGRILIKENDPEVSFIDSMFIRATAADSSEKLLYPKSNMLRFDDGNYLRLSQGEKLEVEFESLRDYSVYKYSLVANGYYVPVRKRSFLHSGAR